MIAEIYGKVSSSGSNLSDRLEDQLTGDFFGAMRYIPFDIGLKKILCSESVHPLKAREIFNECFAEDRADYITFWPPYKDGELDALIEMDNAVIGIEVKYRSGLSSDDDIDNAENDDNSDDSSDVQNGLELKSMEESRNQLSRESRIVKERCMGQQQGVLLFIAVDSACRAACNDVAGRNIIDKDVLLCSISWQDILFELKKLHVENCFQRTIIEDLISLLTKKGFEQFKDMLLDEDICISRDNYFMF